MSTDSGNYKIAPLVAPPRGHLDPVDAPVPVAATLRRQRLIGADGANEISDMPAPVRPRAPPVGHSHVQASREPVSVRAMPSPTMRRYGPTPVPRAAREDLTQTIEDALRSRQASAPPAVPRVKKDAAMDWAPVVVVVALFGIFAGLLVTFAG